MYQVNVMSEAVRFFNNVSTLENNYIQVKDSPIQALLTFGVK